MDKTISISLGGFSFIIDDAAYAQLKKYLDAVRRSLGNMDGSDDIMSDVEIRIAELFRQRMEKREVVNPGDVDYVKEIMGRPEQYMDDSGLNDSAQTDEESKKTFSEASSASSGTKRKLYRDSDDKIVGGVLSGLAHYMGIEPWITRLLWIFLLLADIPMTGTSFTFLAYIILWIIVPKANTATQKYEMMGEAGDFESIKRTNLAAGGNVKEKNTTDGFSEVIRTIGKIILFFIGFFLIFMGLILLMGGISVLALPKSFVPMRIFNHIVDYSWEGWLAKFFGFLLIAVPGIISVWLGARLISKRVKFNKWYVLTAAGVWLGAMLGSSILTTNVISRFSKNIEYSNKSAYTVPGDTLTLSFEDYKMKTKTGKSVGIISWGNSYDMGDLEEFNGELNRKLNKSLEIRRSQDDKVYVDVVYSSKGSSLDNARENAEKTQYDFVMSAKGKLTFNNHLSLPKGAKFRDQNVKLVVYVPENKIVHSENIKNVLVRDEQMNKKNYLRGNNKFYKFVDREFECLNCNSEDVKEIHAENGSSVSITDEGIKIQSGSKNINISDRGIEIQDGEEVKTIKEESNDTIIVNTGESDN